MTYLLVCLGNSTKVMYPTPSPVLASVSFNPRGGSLLLKSTVGAVWDAFLPSLNSLMKTSLRIMSLASLKIVEKMTVTLSDLASTYMVSSSL